MSVCIGFEARGFLSATLVYSLCSRPKRTAAAPPLSSCQGRTTAPRGCVVGDCIYVATTPTVAHRESCVRTCVSLMRCSSCLAFSPTQCSFATLAVLLLCVLCTYVPWLLLPTFVGLALVVAGGVVKRGLLLWVHLTQKHWTSATTPVVPCSMCCAPDNNNNNRE